MQYPPLANNHISVDCVLMGFDGERLNVLLIHRSADEDGDEYHDMKLPGSLIYQDEDLDEAATRVLYELTGLKKVSMMQFKAFGSRNRTSDPRDVRWLERAQKAHVERIVTIAYLALVKIDRADDTLLSEHNAEWIPLDAVGQLAFDHNLILKEAIDYVRREANGSPAILFDLLPRKFTALQLRTLFEVVFDKKTDVRNFHKKIGSMPYIVALAEREQGVPHRAARFYRFDRKIYNRGRR
ncbi:MAG: NUDIX hydrolase [Muribaculum sp.]|nr:NUDIX hydrolase [Muribaculum sp.]